MKKENRIGCPICDSKEFVTTPNRYDIMKFKNGRFAIVNSAFTNDEHDIFCRNCGTHIDENLSMRNKEITLKASI